MSNLNRSNLSIKKKTLVLFGLRMSKSIFTVLLLSLGAKYFGISLQRDIWLLALNCVLVLDLAIWGPLNETFRAKFIFIVQEEGQKAALDRVASLYMFTNVLTALIVLILLLFPEHLARLLAPKFNIPQLRELILLLRILLPSFLFNQVIQLSVSILNAFESYYLPEISGIVSAIVNTVLLVFTAKYFGIYSLAIAYYISIFVYLTLIIMEMKKLRIVIPYSIGSWDYKLFLPFIYYSLPFFLPYFAGQISQVIEKSIASSIGVGMVASIDYSRKFTDLIVGILSSVLTTIMVPILSSAFSKGDTHSYWKESRSILQIGFLILTLLIGIIYSSSNQIIGILYGNSFSLTQSKIVNSLMIYYAISGVSIFLYLFIGLSLLSLNKGKYYAVVGIGAQLTVVIMNLLLYQSLGVSVFPITVFISHVAAALIMLYFLPNGKISLMRTFITRSALLAFLIIICKLVLIPLSLAMSLIAGLIFNSICVSILLLILAIVFKLDESRIIFNKIQYVVKKK